VSTSNYITDRARPTLVKFNKRIWIVLDGLGPIRITFNSMLKFRDFLGGSHVRCLFLRFCLSVSCAKHTEFTPPTCGRIPVGIFATLSFFLERVTRMAVLNIHLWPVYVGLSKERWDSIPPLRSFEQDFTSENIANGSICKPPRTCCCFRGRQARLGKTKAKTYTANPTWGDILKQTNKQTFSNAVSKLKAQSSNVSFHSDVAKETFEFWALSFRKCHPKWDWL